MQERLKTQHFFSFQGYVADTAALEEASKSGVHQVNASLIRRFNQHSTMVLKACSRTSAASTAPSPLEKQAKVMPVNGTTNHHMAGKHTATEHTEGEPPPKKVRIQSN